VAAGDPKTRLRTLPTRVTEAVFFRAETTIHD
jgi:hypothetical protein